jgi:aspartate oxidase
MNDNMRDTVCMVYDIFKTNYGITKTSTAGTNNMNELISKLDKMPYDMLKEVSPEQMQMVRENKVIQGLVGQIDSVMQNNQRVMTKLRTMNLDSRIRELLNNLKPC